MINAFLGKSTSNMLGAYVIMKKILSLLLALVLVFGMIPAAETAAANTDSVKWPQNVTRVFGADRYATAFKAADTLKAEMFIDKFPNIIVASGTGFADALAGSYLAAVKTAPILLVKGSNVNAVKEYIKANLADRGTVYLLGGVNAVPKTMETGLENFNVMRLGGNTRYDTNLLILKEAGVGDKDIIVCTGLNFADSLSASATGLPILLVKDGLLAAQKDFLAATSGKKIIVGGTGAVNATIEKQLTSYGSVKRLAGNTRYDTSVLVAQEFFANPEHAVLAYAQNFPDGLSGGPLAYELKAPLILTDNNKPTAAVNYATELDISSGYVLGGTGLISDKVVNNVFFHPSEKDETEDEKGEIPQDSWFTLYPTDMTLKVGEEYAIMASFGGGTSVPAYASGDPAVAAVDAYGKVTALSEGTTVITGFYSGLIQICTVTVIPNETEVPEETEPEIGPAVSIEKYENNGPWDYGYVGNSLSFNVAAKTANGAGRRVAISSSNDAVATVIYSNDFGVASVKILFLEAGTATITITSDDGNASTSFTIDVKCYDAMEVATPEDFEKAANYVIGLNGISVSNGGSYTVLTLPWYALDWDEARVQAQNTAHKCWLNGFASGGCSYQGLNENGEYVFHMYTN